VPRAIQKLQRLTIFLIKEEIKNYEDTLDSPSAGTRKPLRDDIGVQGTLFLEQRNSREPQWLDFLRSGVLGTLDPFSADSLSAVLFVKTSQRIFALTFGRGRYMLKPDAFDRTFGLRAVVNRVEPSQIQTLDLKKFEDVPIKRHDEVSRPRSLKAFGINVRQDMLRAVTGKPSDGSLAEKIMGADAVVIHARMGFRDIPAKCRRLLEAARDTVYRRNGFRWIDNLKPVREAGTIAELNNKLVDSIKARRFSHIEMMLPDAVNPADVESIAYSDNNADMLFTDLNPVEWCNSFQNDLANLDIDELKQKRIRLYGPDEGPALRSIPAFDCLCYETELADGDRYILSDGDWFALARTFDNEISEYITKISSPCVSLPDAQSAHDSEDAYIAALDGGRFLRLHRVNLRVHGDQVEVCDVLSPAGHLVHLKMWTQSATFSHLLSQGVVSAESLLRYPQYRNDVRGALPVQSALRSLFHDSDFAPHKLQVVYGLIRKSSRQLPFFSRLNLLRFGERVEALGFRVAFVRIPVV
jgi:uncharacterized protein (TIGR04141 family)